MKRALTQEQQKLVEDNHNLIYHVLHDNRWSVEDYYGIAAIGLCKAAIAYDGRNGVPFVNFACRVIKQYALKDMQYRNAKKRKGETVSFEHRITDTLTLGEILPHAETPETEYAARDALRQLDAMPGKNGRILKLVMCGYSRREIAEMVGVKYSTMGNAVARAKQRLIATGAI